MPNSSAATDLVTDFSIPSQLFQPRRPRDRRRRQRTGAPGKRSLATASAIASLILTFLLVTLEVRQFFQGPFLDAPGRSHAEMISYSFAWAILGILFLAAGILRQSPLLRWASLILMFTAAIKVFIFDMADLRDLLRVLSFAGLGLSLMALGFVYQHFVFRRPAPPAPAT